MQSCSVHHCVLFLLTLTLTTDPGSAACVFPIYATLHQSVTLPCETQCSGRAKWALDNYRDVVFARCDQTSCTSVKEGFNMFYDQFKKGDLSLTITNPDYSMRNNYTCECATSDYATVNLRISTVSSTVQMSPEGDLKLDVSVPEPVEVIYRGSVLSDDVQICTVTNRRLQCKSEYTPRTSLSYPELTLRHMERSESGTYTIRNLDYKEDISVYAVSVSGLTSGEIAGIVIGVLLLLLLWLLTAGVLMYRQMKVNREMNAVNKAPLHQMKEKIDALEQKYSKDKIFSGQIEDFCYRKRRELGKGLMMNEVDELYKEFLEHLKKEDKKEAERVRTAALEKISDLHSSHGEFDDPLGTVNVFCFEKRIELDIQYASSKTELAKQLLEKRDEAVEILKNLKREASGTRFTTDEQLSKMTSRVKSHLLWIDDMCTEQKQELKDSQSILGEESEDIPICYMEALLNELQHWSEDKQSELTKYMKEVNTLKKMKVSNDDLSTAHNRKREEDTLLTKI